MKRLWRLIRRWWLWLDYETEEEAAERLPVCVRSAAAFTFLARCRFHVTIRSLFVARWEDGFIDSGDESSRTFMLRWRLLVEDGREAGRTFAQPDLILAATALEHDLVVVTRNVKDFEGLGLTIFNPWDGNA